MRIPAKTGIALRWRRSSCRDHSEVLSYARRGETDYVYATGAYRENHRNVHCGFIYFDCRLDHYHHAAQTVDQ